MRKSYHFKMVTLVMVLGVSSCSLPPNQNHDRSNSVQTKTKWMNDPKADLNIERGLTAFLNTEVGLVVSLTIYRIRLPPCLTNICCKSPINSN